MSRPCPCHGAEETETYRGQEAAKQTRAARLNELKLRRHGETTRLQHVDSSSNPEPATSTDIERADGQISGVVQRYKKEEQASSHVTAMALIKAQYADAIEYSGLVADARGAILFLGVFGACGVFVLSHLSLASLIQNGLDGLIDQIFTVCDCLFIVWSLYFLFYTARTELFQPEDEPVIFYRKNRKVYRIYRDAEPGFIGLFKRWPICAAEYEWDLIDAEHNAVLTTTGSSVMRYHSLIFLIRKGPTDSPIIDNFQVGSTLQLGELTVGPVWEHLRRFMEENGPHLPPGEVINPNKPPQSLWESWVEVAPLGPSYIRRWKSVPAFMAVIHILFPFFVPLFFFWGIFNWLSHKTAIKVEWPQEVLDARGWMPPSEEYGT